MSYEISLLQPTVFRGLIERFTAPEEMTLLNKVQKTSNPFPTISWEAVRGSRTIAGFNVPNSEADIVDSIGRETFAASFAYLREKKVFTPTTIHWLRQAANSTTDYNRVQAERAVLQEVEDLNRRFDNRAEWMLWQAIQGSVDITLKSGSTQTVDFGFRNDHFLDVAKDWRKADPTSIVQDIRAAKRLVREHGGVAVTDAFTNEATFDAIFDTFVQGGTTATGEAKAPGAYITDAMKAQYYASGTLPNFLGVNWSIQDSVYDATDAAYTDNPTSPYEEQKFLADNKIVFGNFQANRPVELVQGPTADDDAPQGFTGKFAKTWKSPDPSARQYLIEWHVLPIVTRPDQFVVIDDITGGTP